MGGRSDRGVVSHARRLCSFWAPGVAIALVLSGCASHPPTIRALRNEPTEYIDHDVSIHGRVVHTVTIPWLGELYLLDDRTGTIPIAADQLPPIGRTLTVRGRVRRLLGVDTTTIGLYIDARHDHGA